MTTPSADRFLLQFAVLFLCVLLMMFGLFHLMRAYDGHPIQGGVLNFDEMFRVNLFVIDLALLIVFECLLILVFIRYTVPALVISTVLVTVLSTVGRRLVGRDVMLPLFALLVRNEYARLDLTDILFLFLLNALLMAFMVAIMYHHQALALRRRQEEAEAARWSPRHDDAPAPGPDVPEPDGQTADPTSAPPK